MKFSGLESRLWTRKLSKLEKRNLANCDGAQKLTMVDCDSYFSQTLNIVNVSGLERRPAMTSLNCQFVIENPQIEPLNSKS